MGLLRIILALAVVLTHSKTLWGYRITGGTVAVEMFFIISGFYMALILNKKYVGKGSYFLFFSNRLLRLFPMYWFILLLTVVFLFSTTNPLSDLYVQYSTEFTLTTSLYLIFSQLFILGQDLMFFFGFNPEQGNLYWMLDFSKSSPPGYSFLFLGQAWTLSLELMFYLIAPFIVRKNYTIICLFILCALGINLFSFYGLGLENDPWTYRFFPTELVFFLFGALSYHLYIYLHTQDYFKSKVQFQVSSFLFFLVVFHPFSKFLPIDRDVFNWFLYIVTFISLPFLFELTKNIKWDNKIGELSYPIYISHMLVISILILLFEDITSNDYYGLVAMFFTIILSVVLVKYIAEPIEAIRYKRTRRSLGNE